MKLKIMLCTLFLSILCVIPTIAAPKDAKQGTYTWEAVGEKWSCYDKNVNLAKGWILQDNNVYFINNDGIMETGWIKNENSWYYLDYSTGILAKNRWVDNYFVDKDGKMTKIQ